MTPQQNIILDELKQKAKGKVAALLGRLTKMEGAAELATELPKLIGPTALLDNKKDLQRVWELFGLYFLNQGRVHEAIPVFYELYYRLLDYQEKHHCHVPKGTSLFWLSRCHSLAQRPVLAKRYMMLALCEDSIRDKGNFRAHLSGAYQQLVWSFGLSHNELINYADHIWGLYKRNRVMGLFPEWILQQLGDAWMIEQRSLAESFLYFLNIRYVRVLQTRLKSQPGRSLEWLAHYLLSTIPGCRAKMNVRSQSTQYDVVGALEGQDVDFRSDLGRYLICECKDWSKPADFTTLAKLARVLESAKCKFGLLFSKLGITGEAHTTAATRELLKVFQDRGIVIIVVSSQDIEKLVSGDNFITMLRDKYEEIRLDLPKRSVAHAKSN
ncbi:MAG: hypothetical protein A4E19_04440 [Nitrospira sp. SG-bin1]|nr:MAG: hypothetical protein A4E19_04440 [Nitrospira sp. SG-bin1]